MARAIAVPLGMGIDGGATAGESRHAAEELDLVAMLRGAQGAHAISGTRRGLAATEARNLAALGSLLAALVGLVVMPLPMGAAAVLLGAKALLSDVDNGKWTGTFGLFVGLVNVGFWAVYTMGFFAELLGDFAVA